MSNPTQPTEDQLSRLRHNLSGPLTAILINCEMILEQDCSIDIRSRAEAVLREARQIHHALWKTEPR